MSRNRALQMAVAFFLILVHFAPEASASWMSDWLGAASTTGGAPNYMEGQARGYLSGGSYSARWPVSQNNNLMSVQPPKLSSGCGGIDFYGGSLSFLKPDMLVKKLQNVMQNSAGLAFQLALDTISPKIATYTGMMEDISNKLNSLSMDDCTAAKGLVSGVRSASEDIAEGIRMGEIGAGIEQGLSDSYSEIKKAVPAVSSLADINNWTNTQKGQPAGTVASMAGCPVDLQKLFPSAPGAYPVSVLKVIGADMGLPADHIDLLRGLVGDIEIYNVTNNSRPVFYVGPCNANDRLSVIDLASNNIEAKNAAGACEPLPPTATKLRDHVNTKMQSILNSLKTKSFIPASDVTFISSMPTPVLYGMRVAIMTGQQASLTPVLVDSATAGMSMGTLRDLLGRYEEVLAYMNGAGRLADSGADCRLGVFSKDLEGQVAIARKNISKVYDAAWQSYVASMQEITTANALNNQLKDLNKQLQEQIAKTFGASVAQRAARSL